MKTLNLLKRAGLVIVVLALATCIVVRWVRQSHEPNPQPSVQLIRGAVPVPASRIPTPHANTRSDLQPQRTPIDRDGANSISAEVSAISVLVLGTDDSPVPNAAVSVDGVNTGKSASRTDTQGRCELDLGTAQPPNYLVVVAAGWEAARQLIPASVPKELVVHLQVGVRLAGTVRWRTDQAIVEGATVFAWRDGCVPRREDVVAAGLGENRFGSRLMSTVTDKVGHFEFIALCRERGYTVSAITAGGISLQRVEGCNSARPQPVMIDLDAVFGAVVRLRSSEGGLPRCGKHVFGRGPAWEAIDDGDAIAQIPVECASLLPEDARELPSSVGFDRFVLLSARERTRQSVGIEYAVELAGYQAVATRFEATQFDKSMPEYEVRLAPTATNWGAIEITCSGGVSTGIAPDSSSNNVLGTVHLIGESGDRWAVIVPKPCTDQPQTIDGIPYGTYQVYFQMRDRAWEYPPANARLTIDIGPRPFVFDIPMDPVGAVLLAVREPKGDDYDGELIIRLRCKSDNTYVAFNRGPFVLENLPCGDYEIAIERLAGADCYNQSLCPFSVTQGIIATPTLTLVR